jgi:hypothetical protein
VERTRPVSKNKTRNAINNMGVTRLALPAFHRVEFLFSEVIHSTSIDRNNFTSLVSQGQQRHRRWNFDKKKGEIFGSNPSFPSRLP